MEGDEVTSARLVAEIPCTCKGGIRVVAVLPDGREFATDAASTSARDFDAWLQQARDRVEAIAVSLPNNQRTWWRMKAKMALISAQLVARVCTDCGGTGSPIRIWQDAA